mgnify:CR=1 FL=1
MDLINIGIIITYIMIAGATLAVLGFGVLRMLSNTKNATKTVYTLGSLVVVFLVAYFFASAEVLPSYEKYNITSGSAKRVGMGLNTFYFLAISSIFVVIYYEFTKAFNK